MGLGLPLKAEARHVFVAGDIAQIVVDWSIDGTGPDGEHVHLGGSASDVVRRGADGRWRYLIDNALGTAVVTKSTALSGDDGDASVGSA